MRSSNAFEAIHDPADPAWVGHAPAPERSGRRMLALWGAAAVVVVLAACVVALAAGSSQPADRTPEVAAASTQQDGDDDVVVPATPRVGATTDAPAAAPTTPAAASTSTAPAASSGWAPAEATVALEDTGSGLVRGDLAGMHPQLYQRLDSLAQVLGQPLRVASGWRTRHEQEGLYQQFLGGTGNLAAVPGTSQHEIGFAADVYVGSVALADYRGAADQAATLGLHFPVAGEAWHVELRTMR